MTPLQAGVILFLRRHAEARLTDAVTAMCVKQPTLVVVVQALVRKHWVIKRRSVQDRRAVCLRLSRQGEVLARKIKGQVRQVSTVVTGTRI